MNQLLKIVTYDDHISHLKLLELEDTISSLDSFKELCELLEKHDIPVRVFRGVFSDITKEAYTLYFPNISNDLYFSISLKQYRNDSYYSHFYSFLKTIIPHFIRNESLKNQLRISDYHIEIATTVKEKMFDTGKLSGNIFVSSKSLLQKIIHTFSQLLSIQADNTLQFDSHIRGAVYLQEGTSKELIIVAGKDLSLDNFPSKYSFMKMPATDDKRYVLEVLNGERDILDQQREQLIYDSEGNRIGLTSLRDGHPLFHENYQADQHYKKWIKDETNRITFLNFDIGYKSNYLVMIISPDYVLLDRQGFFSQLEKPRKIINEFIPSFIQHYVTSQEREEVNKRALNNLLNAFHKVKNTIPTAYVLLEHNISHFFEDYLDDILEKLYAAQSEDPEFSIDEFIKENIVFKDIPLVKEATNSLRHISQFVTAYHDRLANTSTLDEIIDLCRPENILNIDFFTKQGMENIIETHNVHNYPVLLSLQHTLEKKFLVSIDKHLIQEQVEELIINALKYTTFGFITDHNYIQRILSIFEPSATKRLYEHLFDKETSRLLFQRFDSEYKLRALMEGTLSRNDINYLIMLWKKSLSHYIQINVSYVYNPREHTITVSVADNGIGIQKECLPKIFHTEERFAPSLASGTGRGLLHLADTIKKHFRHLSEKEQDEMKLYGVMSEYGKGSTFWFKLPVLDVE
ncbi:ATP-binding protein [Candidatus Margulisiibacteriota bacterium]